MLELKKRPKSPFWYARGTVAGKRVEVSTKCKRLADAKAALPDIIAELCADTDDQQDELTFVRALRLYQEQKPDARFLDPVKRYFADKLVPEIANAEMRRVYRYLSPLFSHLWRIVAIGASLETLKRHSRWQVINWESANDQTAPPKFQPSRLCAGM
jgi:hypothetical protein